MDRYQKISENFHGRRFDFHGKKSAAWVHTYAQYTRARTYPRAYAYAYARTKACVRWRTRTCVLCIRTCVLMRTDGRTRAYARAYAQYAHANGDT